MIAFYQLAAVLAVLYFLYYFLTRNKDYWKKRNVAYVKPSPIFGNYTDYVLLRKFGPKVAQQICLKFPLEPYVGVFYGTDPALIVQDPNLIKLVMVKDFQHFSEREVSEYSHKEVITRSMFFSGGDNWKILRQNLSTLFTSSKIRNMFYLIEGCADTLDKTLRKELATSSVVDMKNLLARYTMDCIGSCAFGVNTYTLTNESSTNPFFQMSKKVINNTTIGGLKGITRSMWPAAFYALGFKIMDDDVTAFFSKLLTDVYSNRKYKPSSRNDFVDLILGWREKKSLSGHKLSSASNGDKEAINLEIDDMLMVSQSVLFFAAGFETTATSLTFLLYELAKNPEAQRRVIEEVDDYFKRHDGKIEFESINEMPFVQACINEALRLYPVLGVITREVSQPYTFPTGLHLEKGTRIHIPVYHLHYNPEYFPEPEKFRPERFLGEEDKKIVPYTYMPFGEGPRVCLGLRFSKMPTYAGLLTILKNYRIELADDMPAKVGLEPRSLATQPDTVINLKVIPRNK